MVGVVPATGTSVKVTLRGGCGAEGSSELARAAGRKAGPGMGGGGGRGDSVREWGGGGAKEAGRGWKSKSCGGGGGGGRLIHTAMQVHGPLPVTAPLGNQKQNGEKPGVHPLLPPTAATLSGPQRPSATLTPPTTTTSQNPPRSITQHEQQPSFLPLHSPAQAGPPLASPCWFRFTCHYHAFRSSATATTPRSARQSFPASPHVIARSRILEPSASLYINE